MSSYKVHVGDTTYIYVKITLFSIGREKYGYICIPSHGCIQM